MNHAAENESSRTPETVRINAAERKFRIFLVVSVAVLFFGVLFSFIYLATTPEATATFLISFVGGVSNIVLPCTLPLVFIIVPLAMVAGGRKGLLMAVLFGLGLTITLAVYGAAVAFVGAYLGLDTATRVMYAIAGIAAFVFGLSELGLLKLELPSYLGMPRFIQKRGDYAKVFLLGLLLGNAGVGCPNPVTYVVLTFAATTGNWSRGAALMAMNGLGRVLPLLLFTVLGILGVNATRWLVQHTTAIKKFSAWVLVLIGSFILLNGVFGHLWYEGGIFHEGLNAISLKAGGKMLGEADVEIETVEKPVPLMRYGSWINLVLILIPLAWYYRKYPQDKKIILFLLFIFLAWALLLFDFGLNAREWLGIPKGLPGA